MAKVTPFGQPANDGERDAIAYLRGHLPDTFEIFHNLEIKQNKEIFEVDLIILAPQCVFIVDVKGTHGQIDIIGPRWYPEKRQAYASPVAKLRFLAKVLSTLISDSNRTKSDLGRVHVQAVALMIADDVSITDQEGKDIDHITYCNKQCLAYFQSSDFIPDKRLKDIRTFIPDVRRAIQGKAHAKSAPPRYRDWQVEEKLGATDRYTEYRARHLLMGTSGWTARLRVYRVDPYQNPSEREAEQKLISNAFQSIYQIPKHHNILSVQEFFLAEDGDSFVLVTEDIPGQSLRQRIKKKNIPLDQRLDIMRQVLIALDHAHKHSVIHRNLTPDNILVGIDDQIRLVGFDYARISNRTSTIAHDIVDDLEVDAIYQATECYRDPANSSITSDLFSVGLIFYELLTGRQAFESAEQICDRTAIFPIKPSILQPDLSSGIDDWLQKLCAFKPNDRFQSADDALKELTTLATLQTLDLANLSVDSPIDDRYRVIERLGRPGSFAVAYKVFDSLDDTVLVLKLVTRDRRSVYERLRQEYKTLRHLPEHRHIVKVIFAGILKDGTPFIIFEYLEGESVEHFIESKKLSLEDAVQIAKETLVGLAHLHHYGVYHQDIKPSNLLQTADGIRIIDFNIAVADGDEVTVSAGTRKYMPPDFKLRLEPTTDEKVDRDLYALGITFYECVTGSYPFKESNLPIGQQPQNPKEIDGFEDLSDELVQVLTKAIASKRADRFSSAEDFLKVITSLVSLRKSQEQVEQDLVSETLVSDYIADDLAVVEQPQEILDLLPVTSNNELPDYVHDIVKLSPLPPEVEVAPSGQSEALEAQVSIFTVRISEDSLAIDPMESRAYRTNAHKTLTLFDDLLSTPSPQCVSKTGKSPKQSVILDPTGLYSPPSECIEIKTEVEWIQSFFLTDGLYWISGRGRQAQRLCDWTREWLRVWNKLDAIIEEKQNPSSRLRLMFGSVQIPQEWTEQQILQLVSKLDSYPQDNPVAHLLGDSIDSDRQVWFEPPSVNHLARWLSVQVPEVYKPLERIWQNQIVEQAPQDLTVYYQVEDKIQLLRQWIGVIEPSAKVKALGRFMLSVPNLLEGEFRAFWERRFLHSEGKVLDEIVPSQQCGMEQIALLAYSILKTQPLWITKERKRKLSSYLNYQQRSDLDNLHPPHQPEALELEASSKDAMQWVTEQYLPFRRWETTIHQSSEGPSDSEHLAGSFVNWILKQYPDIRLAPAQSSVLNHSVATLVQDLCQEGPVLWIVVDGLGWLDHQELLGYLTENNSFAIEVALQPRISIIPTKTEYAKWSLYTQLLPSHSSWVNDAGKGFPMMGVGKRYTDYDYKRGSLHRDLKANAHQLYCWDTDKFDHLYHTEQDWQNLYQVQRPHVLRGIASDIKYCIEQHPNPELLRIVIASDHGQMMGEAKHINDCPEGLDLKGRMAVGETKDPRFVVLEAERYGLPHTLSIVRGAACLNAFRYTDKKDIIGSHGGLFPEEVLVGVSVLRQFVARLPVQVLCTGEGKPGQPGELMVSIDNPNSVPLTHLCLYINELTDLKSGYLLTEVPGNKKVTFKIMIARYPELPQSREGNQLSISGELQFQFSSSEAGTAALDSKSMIIINQMFSSGFDIDEFF